MPVQVFKHAIMRTDNNFPDGPFGLHAALFMVAQKGHTEVCKVIVDILEDKNPSDNTGVTPFHHAAEKGHVDICKILMKNLANLPQIAERSVKKV